MSADLHVSAPSCGPKVLHTRHLIAEPAGKPSREVRGHNTTPKHMLTQQTDPTHPTHPTHPPHPLWHTPSADRMHLVQWMQRVMMVLTRGPMFLSSTALFPKNWLSTKRLRSLPKAMDWSWRSHSPPWSQMGQSRGWLTSRNSITPSLGWGDVSLDVTPCHVTSCHTQLALTWPSWWQGSPS